MSDNTNTTYVVDDGDGPELWRSTEGENTQDELLLTKGELRATVWHHMPLGATYLPAVDRLWDAIAATATPAPAEPVCNCGYSLGLGRAGAGHHPNCDINLPADKWAGIRPEQVQGLRPEIDPDAWRAEVEAASAPDDAIEALVGEYAEGLAHKDYSAGSLFLSFHEFAARVLEVGGQQHGVPVEVRALIHAADRMRDDWAEGNQDRKNELWVALHVAADTCRALAPGEAGRC